MSKRTLSQIGRGSRRKGKRFEVWCANYFTQQTGLKWETTRNSGRTDLKGDIYCVSRPDLSFVVECKNDKHYSVHAMLKPTKKFASMVCDLYARPVHKEKRLIIIVKNDTGVWVLMNPAVLICSKYHDVITTGKLGQWCRIQHLTDDEFNGVIFGEGFTQQ